MEKEKKPIYKKIWFWIIVVIIVVGIGAGSGNSNTVSTTTNVQDLSTNMTDKEENKTSEKTQIKAGEEVSTKDTKITFKSAEDYTGYSQYSTPKEGNKVIRAEFAFENISTSDISLSNLECYADGEKCDAYYSAEDYKNPTLESLSSGKKMTAVVYYEVPESAESIVLEYETNLWTNDKVEFIVK